MKKILNEDYILSLYNKYKKDLIFLKEKMSLIKPIGAFGDVEGEITYLLLRESKPLKVLEFSPNKGWSSCYILNALYDNNHGQLYSFDIHNDSDKFIPENLKGRRHFYSGDLKNNLHHIPDNIDYCFIDSDHSKAFAEFYIKDIFPKVKENSVYSVHDIYHESGKTYDEFLNAYTEVNYVLDFLNKHKIQHFKIGLNCMFVNKIKKFREDNGIKDMFNSDNQSCIFFIR